MKTQDEIVARVRELEAEGRMLDFRASNLIAYLDYDHAKEFIKPEVTREEWDKEYPYKTGPVDQIKEYMDFAWEKANNCRGLSASRSLNHMEAWLWLDGQEEFIKAIDIGSYKYYGKGKLVKICEKYGIDWKKLDNGSWQSDEMSDGVTADVAMANPC